MQTKLKAVDSNKRALHIFTSTENSRKRHIHVRLFVPSTTYAALDSQISRGTQHLARDSRDRRRANYKSTLNVYAVRNVCVKPLAAI